MMAERAASNPGVSHRPQARAADARLGSALSDTEVMRKFLEDPKAAGPARGVMAELTRIDHSGQRQASAAVEARCAALGWSLEHLGVTIGTVIHGPDLRAHQSDEAIAAMHTVMLERKVIFFREQDIDHAQHRAFGLQFGSLEVFPFAAPPADFPEILPITSGRGAPTGASVWHSDVTWRKSPSLGSMLYCATAPPFGGETGFADTYATFQVTGIITTRTARCTSRREVRVITLTCCVPGPAPPRARGAAWADGPDPPFLLSAHSVSHSKSVLWGFCAGAEGLNRPKRRFPARAVRPRLRRLPLRAGADERRRHF
jgi:hypothetical protein